MNKTIDEKNVFEDMLDEFGWGMMTKVELVDEEVAYSKPLNKAAVIRVIRITHSGRLVCYTTRIIFHTLGTKRCVTAEYSTKTSPEALVEHVREAKKNWGGACAYFCVEQIDKRMQEMVKDQACLA